MNDEPVSIPPSLISLGGERPLHIAVDASRNVPLAPVAPDDEGAPHPVQLVDLDDLHAAIDPDRPSEPQS